MTIEYQFRDEKIQYDINRRAEKLILLVKKYCHLINGK